MLIRQGRLSDLDAVYETELANFGPEVATSYEAFAERLHLIPDTFLVAELDGQFAGYVEGPVVMTPVITDDLFHKVNPNPPTGGYIAITSLSVPEIFKGQGHGTTLLAAMKDLAVAQGREGIVLTCQEYLLPYYEMNGFVDQGLSDSQHGGQSWYQMIWEVK